MTVPGLVIGEVVRGSVVTIGSSLGACQVSTDCPDGVRNASSALLTLPEGAAVERAVLVWEGDSNEWAGRVGLVGPVAGTASHVDDADAGAEAVAGVVGVDFRSTADVTDVVRANGSGRYTVVRSPSTSVVGEGTWTMVVVSRQPDSPRRLAVVVRPGTPMTGDAPWTLEVPIAGSAGVEPTNSALRPLTVMVQARASAAQASMQRRVESRT